MGKFKKILMMGYTGKELDGIHMDRLDQLCEEKILISKDDPGFSDQLAEADVLLVKLGAKVDKELISHGKNLKYIGMLGTGFGRIDTELATSRGIIVCNIEDYATQSVVEFVIGTVLDHIRELEKAKKQAREGNYSEDSFFNISEIKGKKFGIIGLGHIGLCLAETLSNGFGADVMYWNRTKKEVGFEYISIDDLIGECDFISLHLSLNKETENILNAERIEKIKSGAVVINFSPMELVDIDALAKRLERGDITFILDHSDEMSKEDLKKLSKLKNCIIYPPQGYTTKESTIRKQGIFVSNLERFLEGKPQNVVN